MAASHHPETLRAAAGGIATEPGDSSIVSCRRASRWAGAGGPRSRSRARDVSSSGCFCVMDRRGPSDRPPVRIAGGIGLRSGPMQRWTTCSGHFGYHVFPPARGHHLRPERCQAPVAARPSTWPTPIWITCNPENQASRRTCEALGADICRDRSSLPVRPALRARQAREVQVSVGRRGQGAERKAEGRRQRQQTFLAGCPLGPLRRRMCVAHLHESTWAQISSQLTTPNPVTGPND